MDLNSKHIYTHSLLVLDSLKVNDLMDFVRLRMINNNNKMLNRSPVGVVWKEDRPHLLPRTYRSCGRSEEGASISGMLNPWAVRGDRATLKTGGPFRAGSFRNPY
ncbi:hypothetical protein TNCV_4006321 [Trichonephila clavipes]|nr:hypothetical protein TNCV_4006321 [Trichonephila clavipes]